MEEKMDELIEAINSVSRNTFIDYLLIILPIVLSFVAICISISVAKKQNQIALLEKRAEAISLLNQILIFSNQIKNIDENNKSGITSICTFFYVNFDEKGLKKDQLNDSVSPTMVMATIEKLRAKLAVIEFLFDRSSSTAIDDIIRKMKRMISDLCLIKTRKDEFWEHKQVFCDACKKFEKEYLPALKEKTRM